MSGGCEILKPQEDDIAKMLAATTHIGSENSEITMEQYIFKRRTDGINVINLSKTWEKLVFAARIIAAVENPADIFVISSRTYGQRAVLKFARYIGATSIAGRFTPGMFTNQVQAAFREPRILIVADPRADHQPITEASYTNIPVIAFSNVDSPTRNIDVCIPCNNKAVHSIGLMFYFLAREVLRLKGLISRDATWEVMPDLFFYRDPAESEELARQEQAAAAAAAAASATVQQGGAPQVAGGADYGAPGGASEANWDEDGAEGWNTAQTGPDVDVVPVGGVAVASPSAMMSQPQPAYQVSSDWANQQQQPGTGQQPAGLSSDWNSNDNWC